MLYIYILCKIYFKVIDILFMYLFWFGGFCCFRIIFCVWIVYINDVNGVIGDLEIKILFDNENEN